MRAIAAALKHNTSVTTLRLESEFAQRQCAGFQLAVENDIGVEGAQALGEALYHNNSIAEIYVEGERWL